jgi:hypothetical protein
MKRSAFTMNGTPPDTWLGSSDGDGDQRAWQELIGPVVALTDGTRSPAWVTILILPVIREANRAEERACEGAV